MGKRLFLAVDIDQRTRDQVGRISTELRGPVEMRTSASWVQPDRMHLTIMFFGSVAPPVEERIRGALAQPIAEAPFDLSFDGLGFFPERGAPRVLWLRIRDGSGELRRIHTALLERDLRRAQPERANEPFTPHLTLARFRDRVPRPKVAEIARIPASAGPSRIDRVTLYESRLSPASLDLGSGQPEAARSGGPAYLPIAEALLTRSS